MTILIDGNGNIGLGTASPSQKLDVDGTARLRSVSSNAPTNDVSLSADGTFIIPVSDRRLQEELQTLPFALAKTQQLRGVSYYWKNDESREKGIGLIAQEVE